MFYKKFFIVIELHGPRSQSGQVPDKPETNKEHAMKRIMISVLTMAVLSCALILSGCGALVGGAAGAAGTYAWTQASLEREYQAGLDQTYEATLQAIEEMGMTIEEREKDIASASIEARMADTSYFISLDRLGEEMTSVSVRVGLLGDEQASRIVHDNINQNLNGR
jgi:uncharacterized protein YceK